MIGGVPLQHRLAAQRWTDSINLWPNAVLAFNHPLGAVADLEIARQGGGVWRKSQLGQTTSRGMLPREILKFKASNSAL